MLRGITPILACSMLLCAPHVYADQDEIEAFRAEIAALRAEVARLKAPDDAWLTEQRADEIRSIVRDVLADADTRASLLGSGLTAGWDNGFKIGSADGNYSLRIAGRQQFRYVYNYQDNSPTDRHRSGFEHRRTRLTFSGHVIDPSWAYQIQGDFNRDGGGFRLLDAYIDKKFDNGITVRFGQFRPKFMTEDHTSSARQLAVERSLINSRFAQSRTQGIEVQGNAGDNVRWSAGYIEGISSTIGDMGAGLNTPWNARTTEFAFIGRVDVLIAGNWRQFREFTSWSDEEFGLMVGAGIVWQKDEYGTIADTNEVEVRRWTVDATAKFGSANAFVAFVGNHEKPSGGSSVDQWGLVAQGGFFFVPDEWEGFVRYEWGDADTVGIKDLSLVTFGVNRYFSKHNLKWTTDVGIGLNEINSFWSSSSAGYRADAPGEDTQVVVRSQLQLAF
jgi:hypothetical protein